MTNSQRSFKAKRSGWCPVPDCPHDGEIEPGHWIIKMPIPVVQSGIKDGRWGRQYVGIKKRAYYAHAQCWQNVEVCKLCNQRHVGDCRS